MGVLELCDHGCLGGLGMRSVKTGSQCFVTYVLGDMCIEVIIAVNDHSH